MPWRDHDLTKKGGLTIRPIWPEKPDTNPPINNYFRSFCHKDGVDLCLCLCLFLSVFVLYLHVGRHLLSSVGLKEEKQAERRDKKRKRKENKRVEERREQKRTKRTGKRRKTEERKEQKEQRN